MALAVTTDLMEIILGPKIDEGTKISPERFFSRTFHPLYRMLCGDYIFICRQNKHIMSGLVSPQYRNVIHRTERDTLQRNKNIY